jgi:membrane protease YdiL (CAAX protease family)
MGMNQSGDYYTATRHPWPCLLFLLPLLLAYEIGVLWFGGTQPDALRNGADAWMRWGLEASGVHQLYAAPLLILVVFGAWSWLRRTDRPKDVGRVCLTMAGESALFALGLWGISRGLGPLLDRLGVPLSVDAAPVPPRSEAAALIITFVGAGIYEEVLFRLLLLSGLIGLLKLADLPGVFRLVLATTVSALLFAAAHHVGPNGEVFDGYVFLFRTLAGLYFALLFQLRGFGIAVGAHASYDVLVGFLVQ